MQWSGQEHQDGQMFRNDGHGHLQPLPVPGVWRVSVQPRLWGHVRMSRAVDIYPREEKELLETDFLQSFFVWTHTWQKGEKNLSLQNKPYPNTNLLWYLALLVKHDYYTAE